MASNAANEYQLVFTKQVEKFLSTIVPKKYYRNITDHLLELKYNPFPHGSIKLQGSQNEYRLRVGVYRILYTVQHNKLIVTVIKIGHRKDVYD